MSYSEVAKMRCTVKELAEISGVSVRTLHWYDEIGLLKPAFYEANGYRYYEEEQLLQLQQILFFRELGFKLKDIQKILASNDFDRLKALDTHRHLLVVNADRIRQLISTVDNTISYLRGKYNMNEQEYYAGFDANKPTIVQYSGTVAEDLIGASVKTRGDMSDADKQVVAQEGNHIYKAIADCIDQNMTPRTKAVQALVEKHYQLLKRYHDLSKEVYLAYAQLYCESPDFRKIFDHINPKLADFIAEAMRFYVKENLI